MNEEIARVVFRKWFAAAILVVVALVVFLLLPGVSHALTEEQKALVGLKGVNVLVEAMHPEAERLGLTRDQIKTDVELRLRKAGVRVLTEEEVFKMPGMPYLYVRVGTLAAQDIPIIAFSIRVELKEWGRFTGGFEGFGGLWDTTSLGTVGTKNIRKIRESLGDLVDDFINNYLAANPKK
ncbi:MAG: hypothetical protein ABSA09_13960 [Desulfobaccales bacterium]|jgi:hypothetical protein